MGTWSWWGPLVEVEVVDLWDCEHLGTYSISAVDAVNWDTESSGWLLD
jgi:hypothetical protein